MRPLNCIWRVSAAAVFAAVSATAVPVAATAQEAETMVATGEFTAPEAPGAKIMTFVIDLPAGLEVPFHSHGGRSIVLFLTGEVVLGPPDGPETTYKAGDSLIEEAGQVLGGRVPGTEPARLVWTIVLPDGAELETPYKQ